MKYLLVAGVIALGAFIGAASASAQITAIEPLRAPSIGAMNYQDTGSFVFSHTEGNRCYVRQCGIPSHGDCEIFCGENETPVCACDCTTRVLGVCSELRGACSCQRKHLPWWKKVFEEY